MVNSTIALKNLYVILVTYNSWHHIKNLIPLLLNDQHIAHIVVVDNGSTDSTVKHCKDFFPSTLIIENKANLGYVKAANKGITFALLNRATDILLLSPSLVIEENFILSLLEKNADIVGPVVVKQVRGRNCYAIGGRLTRFLSLPVTVWHDTKPPLSFNTSPQFLSATCLLIRRKVFEKIGLFDEQFYAYYADIMFCLKAKKSGLRINLAPKAVAYKQREIITRPRSLRAMSIARKDRETFSKMYLPFFGRLADFCLRSVAVISGRLLPLASYPFLYE